MIKKITVRDNSLFQRDVSQFSAELIDNPLLNGQLIENVSLSATTYSVSHGLGRAYRGYIVVKRNANQLEYVDTTSTANPTTHIPLKAGGAVTVSLWVF